MATSQILAFGIGLGANVLDYTDYNAATWRQPGFSAGIARSQHVNTVMRQASFVAAALAKATSDLTVSDVLDDGDLAGLVTKIKAAITSGSGVTSFNTRTGAITLTLADVNAAQTGKLVLHSDPTAALGAATKQYVDSVATGLKLKNSVDCATTANITLSGEQTIDGVTTSASRVLVKNQSSAAANGIYVSGAGAWTRATDIDDWTEVPGAFAFVNAGTANNKTSWTCTSPAGGTIGSTAMTWTQFSAAGNYTSSDGITLTGSNFTLSTMAAATVKGRASGAGTGVPQDLDGDDLAAIVSAFTGDSGSGGAKGSVPAPSAGDAAAGKFLDASGGWSSPGQPFTNFAGRGSNGSCSVNATRGFGSVTRTASGSYYAAFTDLRSDLSYGVTITTNSQNVVSSYTKDFSGIYIWLQNGNATVGAGPQNPTDVTIQVAV
jgi:hypothetical protein